jgi:hypothetical protein
MAGSGRLASTAHLSSAAGFAVASSPIGGEARQGLLDLGGLAGLALMHQAMGEGVLPGLRNPRSSSSSEGHGSARAAPAPNAMQLHYQQWPSGSEAPKTLGWRMRSRIGKRVRWYQIPEEVGH